MTKTRIAALALGPALALLAPSAPALAFSLSYERSQRHTVPAAPFVGAPAIRGDGQDVPGFGHCAASSAAEGNANQQTRPVKQYGQNAGGYRC